MAGYFKNDINKNYQNLMRPVESRVYELYFSSSALYSDLAYHTLHQLSFGRPVTRPSFKGYRINS